MLEQDGGHAHLEVVCEPHKKLPVEVWMGSILLAQLPSRESLGELNRHYVLQRLRHRHAAGTAPRRSGRGHHHRQGAAWHGRQRRARGREPQWCGGF